MLEVISNSVYFFLVGWNCQRWLMGCV